MNVGALPVWLPWWAITLVAIPALLWLLLFLLVPFSVFGVKERLDMLDARLDALQAELRGVSEHLGIADPPPSRAARPARTEPRFDWPR